MPAHQTTSPKPPAPKTKPPTAGPIPTTPSSGPPNPEKRDPVSQNKKDAARFARVRLFIQDHLEIFARQGAVAPTWRTYNGKRLGPYYQLAYRDRGRQHWLYLGRSEQLARQVRELLANLHRPRDQHRIYSRLQAQARSSLRQATAHLKEVCEKWGITLKGYEFRGARNGLARYVEAHARASPHRGGGAFHALY
jgi:uncharacterized protein DUF1678